MLYEGGLKKLTTTRYPAYPVMSYSVSRTGYVVGYVVRPENFMIDRNHEVCFFKAYHSFRIRPSHAYPEEIEKHQRDLAISEIMLEIYEEKIHLEQISTILSEIQSSLEIKIRPKRFECINRILKTSTVFFTIYLSLFGEHEGQRLKLEQILIFLQFLEELLRGLTDKESLASNPTQHCEKIWNDLLHARYKKTNASVGLTTAWMTFYDWREKRKLDCSMVKDYDHEGSLKSIIYKIIFFSTVKTIHRWGQNNKK
jgi:hypothetical protein